MARARAVLRGAFSNAVARRLIEWDPWTAVEPEAGHEPHIVDPDLVMTPDQITALAAACAAIDPRYEASWDQGGHIGLGDHPHIDAAIHTLLRDTADE